MRPITVFGPWVDGEADAIADVLDGFDGAEVRYTGSSDFVADFDSLFPTALVTDFVANRRHHILRMKAGVTFCVRTKLEPITPSLVWRNQIAGGAGPNMVVSVGGMVIGDIDINVETMLTLKIEGEKFIVAHEVKA